MNKRFYNILFLVLKILIAIAVIWFLTKKFSEFTKTYSLSANIWNWIPTQNQHLFVIAFLLVFVNWGLEAFKWKILINNITNKSFLSSIGDVLRGISISVFTPNRNGEFIGRIYSIQDPFKIKALELYFVGSLSQQFYTILFGFIALMLTHFSIKIKLLALVLLIGALMVVFYINKILSLFSWLREYSDKIQILKSIDYKMLYKLLFLSGTRYLVFFFQYLILFWAYELDLPLNVLTIIIPCIFFIGSYIPNFALLEMGVKSIIAIYLLSTYTNNEQAIVLASFSIWLINVAIPAMVGAISILITKGNKVENGVD